GRARLPSGRGPGRVGATAWSVGAVGAVRRSTSADTRRTESALARFNASSRAGDVELFVGDPSPSQLSAFAAVDGVDSLARLRGDALMFPGASNLQAVAAAVDTRFGTVVDRPRVVAGRAADPTAVDEVTIGEALAAQLHLKVQDHLDGASYTSQQVTGFLSGGFTGPPVPKGPHFQVRIVGIVRRPLHLGDRGSSGRVPVLAPA